MTAVNIREARKAKGITMKELGRLVGTTESAISLYERGMREPSYETLLKIAEELDTSVGYLLGAETKKAPADDGEDLADYLQDLRERPETRALLEASRGMTKEQVEQMAAFAKSLRGGG